MHSKLFDKAIAQYNLKVLSWLVYEDTYAKVKCIAPGDFYRFVEMFVKYDEEAQEYYIEII